MRFQVTTREFPHTYDQPILDADLENSREAFLRLSEIKNG